MIAECQQQETPFGVVLAKPESLSPREEPYSIGTIAEIRDLSEMEDGRYVLMATGMKRFRILSKHRMKPYLSGVVELYEDVVEPQSALASPPGAASAIAYLEHTWEVLLTGRQ